jgi:hypothetical protein
LFQGATELGWLSFPCELFFYRPVLVVAKEDAVTVAVKAEWDAAAAQQAAEQAEIAAGVFGGKELGDKDFTGSVVEEAEQGELWAAIFQPAVEAGVEQKHFAFASAGQAALTVSGNASFAGRADASATEKTAESFPAEGKTFDLTELFAEMVIVEACVSRACQMENACARGFGQAVRAGTAAAGVCQSRCAALPVANFEAMYLTRRKVEQLRGSGTRQVSLNAG